MAKLQFPESMTCESVSGYLKAFVDPEDFARKHGVELRGRLRGHLLACEECSVAFAEVIDRSFAEAVPTPEIPPMPLPTSVSDLEVQRAVRGTLWDRVKTAAGGASSPENWTKWADLCQRLKQTFSLVGTSGGLDLPSLRESAARAMGQVGEVTEVEIRHLDRDWQETDMSSRARILEGPTIEEQGEFLLALELHDTSLINCEMICSIKLVAGEALHLEARSSPAEGGRKVGVVFRASGLPTEKSITLPLDYLSLYAVLPVRVEAGLKARAAALIDRVREISNSLRCYIEPLNFAYERGAERPISIGGKKLRVHCTDKSLRFLTTIAQNENEEIQVCEGALLQDSDDELEGPIYCWPIEGEVEIAVDPAHQHYQVYMTDQRVPLPQGLSLDKDEVDEEERYHLAVEFLKSLENHAVNYVATTIKGDV